MLLSRRRLLFGAAATLVAAPAIVRVASLMAVKPLKEEVVYLTLGSSPARAWAPHIGGTPVEEWAAHEIGGHGLTFWADIRNLHHGTV